MRSRSWQGCETPAAQASRSVPWPLPDVNLLLGWVFGQGWHGWHALSVSEGRDGASTPFADAQGVPPCPATLEKKSGKKSTQVPATHPPLPCPARNCCRSSMPGVLVRVFTLVTWALALYLQHAWEAMKNSCTTSLDEKWHLRRPPRCQMHAFIGKVAYWWGLFIQGVHDCGLKPFKNARGSGPISPRKIRKPRS